MLFVQDIKKSGGIDALAANIGKVKLEAERLEVLDKAAGILAEVLYTQQLLTEIKEYRPIMIHVSQRQVVSSCCCCNLIITLLLYYIIVSLLLYNYVLIVVSLLCSNCYVLAVNCQFVIFIVVYCGKPEGPEIFADWV